MKKTNQEQAKISKNFNRVLCFAKVCIIFAAAVVCLSLIYVQFIRGDDYKRKASIQQTSGITIPAKRGTIYDCNGNAVAVTIPASRITVDTESIREQNEKNPGYAEEAAEFISKTLGLDKEKMLKQLTAKSKWVDIASEIEADDAGIIEKWISGADGTGKKKGFYLKNDDTKRYYPYGSLASHVIGFTNADNHGTISGIERTYDSILSGVDGKTIAALDAKNNVIATEEVSRIEPDDGKNVGLTVDMKIQSIVEKELAQGSRDFGISEGCCAIVMNPKNGDIISMASNPTFDLNDPFAMPDTDTEFKYSATVKNEQTGESEEIWTYLKDLKPESWVAHSQDSVNVLQNSVWKNQVISKSYEPGSTFKSITASVALEEGLVTPETEFSDAPFTVRDRTIHCWDLAGHGTESVRDAMIHSCNPILAQIGELIGVKRFYDYFEAYGFKNKTGIDLAGETGGVYHKNPTEVDLATASFGQRFTITALQLASAYSAIANGGILYQPRIVKEITDNDGNIVERKEPNPVRQVISKETSDTMIDILESAAGSTRAYVSGYRVCGKTGTSETTTAGRNVCSFACFAPADDPQIVVLVVVDNPTVGGASGGVHGASIAGRIVSQVLESMDVEKRYTQKDLSNLLSQFTVGKYENMRVYDAKYDLNLQNFSYLVVGEDSDDAVVIGQYPPAGTMLARESTIILYTAANVSPTKVRVPDFRNLSLEDAHATVVSMSLSMKVPDGYGTVVSQSIEPGTYVDKGTVIEFVTENEQTKKKTEEVNP